MKNWIKKIFKNDRTQQENHPATDGMGSAMMSSSQAEKMVQMINKTQEVELTCDEVHDLLGEFAQMALRNENPAKLLPLVSQHLELCPDCREEYDALMQILQADPLE
ncbi:MAG TPA: hypothetical protein VN364_04450 [Bellilinea sp.]|nr:hypothetical protein [Bellilinea sp.]